MSSLPAHWYPEVPVWINEFQWLATVGARTFKNPNWQRVATGLILNAIEYVEVPDSKMGITSGGAEGIDSLGEALADELWFRKVIYPPAQPVWEPDGFKARNERIAVTCNWMIGIRCETTKTWGTGHACQTAEEYGKVVWRFVIHGNPACEGCAVEENWKGSCGW